MEPDSSHPFSTHHTWYMSQPRTVKTPCALYVSIYYLTTVNPSLHALTCMHMYAIHTTPHYANIDDVSGRQSVIPFLFLFLGIFLYCAKLDVSLAYVPPIHSMTYYLFEFAIGPACHLCMHDAPREPMIGPSYTKISSRPATKATLFAHIDRKIILVISLFIGRASFLVDQKKKLRTTGVDSHLFAVFLSSANMIHFC